MNPSVSAYLNLVRLTAAVCVFMDHFKGMRFSGGFLWQFGVLGTPALAVFFVLSGFVIGHLCSDPTISAARFGVDRAARMLSVAVPALVATFALDALGSWLHPEAYEGFEYPSSEIPYKALVGVTFLNEAWQDVRIGSNLPYWSLGFEVPFYLAFGVWTFGRGAIRWLGVALVLAAAGPTVAGLFPMWLIGVVAHRISRADRLGPLTGILLAAVLAAGSLAFLATAVRQGWDIQLISPNARPLLSLWPDYLIGLVFALTVVGVSAADPLLRVVADKAAGPIAAAAGVTFSLYLFHLPLILFLRAVSPWPAASWQNRTFLLAGVGAVVIGVARVTEYRRHRLRTLMWSMLPTAVRRRAATVSRPGK